MYVATSRQMKAYDQALLNEGYSIEELVDKASNAILPHCLGYNNIVIVCGPGNNGADGLSLGIKLHIRARNVKLYCFGNPNKFSQANNFYIEQAQEMEVPITFMDEEDIAMAYINSNEARKLNINDKENVSLISDNGKITVKIVVDDCIGDNIVMMYAGWWKRHGNPNYLTISGISDIGGQVTYHETLVEIVKEKGE